MARILVAYKEFPAPSVGHAGGQGVFRLISCLHRRGHEVFLVCREKEEEAVWVEETRPFCARLVTVPHHRSLPGPRPLAMVRSYWMLRRASEQMLREARPDLLFIEFAQTAVALLGLRASFTSFRPHDVNWFLMEQQLPQVSGPRQWAAWAGSRFFRWLEPWLCRRHDQVVAISEGDRRLLAPLCAPRKVLLLPLEPAFVAAADAPPAVPAGPNVLFVGAMYRSFNVDAVRWFLDQVWPHVVEQVPAARFYVVGYKPPDEILACDDGEHVFVTGFVDDLAPWYRAAALVVSPMLVAGGLLQKVLDGLSMGLPIVATSVSNHGVGATPGEHLLVADDPAAFARAVVRLLQDPERRERLGRAGQAFVRQQYDLDQAVERWERSWGLALRKASLDEGGPVVE
ncbi:MAG: glycosyltransferase [Anaerolineae bacterium]|nr:glycosyltransferase [Anaerolineae bacterium]